MSYCNLDGCWNDNKNCLLSYIFISKELSHALQKPPISRFLCAPTFLYAMSFAFNFFHAAIKTLFSYFSSSLRKFFYVWWNFYDDERQNEAKQTHIKLAYLRHSTCWNHFWENFLFIFLSLHFVFWFQLKFSLHLRLSYINMRIFHSISKGWSLKFMIVNLLESFIAYLTFMGWW